MLLLGLFYTFLFIIAYLQLGNVMPEFSTKVLLAEDESVAREILEFYLNTIFDEVIVAKDGAEGLEAYKKALKENKEIDLVLTDIKMPNMDGIDMLERIYNLNKNQKFIIVSAYKDEHMLLKSIDLKVLGYFIKPLNVDNVMEMLTKAKDEVLEDQRKNRKESRINDVYSYNYESKILYENGKLVKLSKKETLALDLLMKNRKNIVKIESFKKVLWQNKETLDATFRTVMKRLKDKIKEKDFILSRKGQGYIIE
jgi:DNA-binding response OmpR family regulator